MPKAQHSYRHNNYSHINKTGASAVKVFALLICCIFSASILFAQNDRVNLLAQSADGKNVKLVWFFKSWSRDITGFDIKRKEGLQKWVKLNSEPILPEISTKKKLSVVESDKSEESRIKLKLFKLISNHTLRETDNSTYIETLSSNSKALQDISYAMMHDYDIALISGFAFIDHTVTRKTNYEYGLFVQGTDILLAKDTWNYGEIPDLNTVQEITSRATTGKSGIQLIWNADLSKMKAWDVAGFNIYREGIRLNSAPIVNVNDNDITEFTWNDRSANTSEPIEYSISAETILGIEGIIKPYTYEPGDHPEEYRKAEVTDVTSLGYYFKEGIQVKWNFPKEYERFVKGFYLEKNNFPAGYKQVSPLLDPATRVFVDKTPSPATTYVSFRITAVYNDKTQVPGIARVYSYFPLREPPAPQNVKIKSVRGDKKVTATITWDTPLNGDDLTDYYKVYVADAGGKRFLPVTESLIKNNSLVYNIQHGTATTYYFTVTAMGKNKTESFFSDTVALQTPSLELPAPVISKSYADSGRAKIQWQFPDISDLKGFRLFQNNVLIANENELRPDMREFKTSKLQPGAAYNFTLRAISENGIQSDYSSPASVNIP
jgi:hypothetical protein